jgi:hypothetical protein
MLCLLPALLTILGWPNPGYAPADTTRSTTPVRAEPRDAATLLTAADRRVRTTDAEIQTLIAEGVRRSRTFAALLRDLDTTDVIVYVERTRKLPAVIAGRLLLVPVTHSQRYLRIQLGTGGTIEDAIATLAHELQHAIEIATDAEVRDDTALVRLYQRIGRNSVGAHAYDTQAAQVAGRTVKQELGS